MWLRASDRVSGNSSDNPIVLDSDEEEEDNEPKGGKSAKPDEPEEAEEGLFARPQSAAGSERKGLSHVEETVLSDDEKPNLVEEERYEFAAVPEEPATQDDQDAAELAQTAPLGTSFSVAAEDPEQGVEGGAELEEFLDIEKGAADLGATADEGSAGGIKRKAEDDSAEADEADPAAKKIRADPAAEE